jgi:hypothetical protein
MLMTCRALAVSSRFRIGAHFGIYDIDRKSGWWSGCQRLVFYYFFHCVLVSFLARSSRFLAFRLAQLHSHKVIYGIKTKYENVN